MGPVLEHLSQIIVLAGAIGATLTVWRTTSLKTAQETIAVLKDQVAAQNEKIREQGEKIVRLTTTVEVLTEQVTNAAAVRELTAELKAATANAEDAHARIIARVDMLSDLVVALRD